MVESLLNPVGGVKIAVCVCIHYPNSYQIQVDFSLVLGEFLQKVLSDDLTLV